MYLHALAAKVMLIRNPARLYMVNAPTAEMERIIATFVPQTFVGTKEEVAAINPEMPVLYPELKKVMEKAAARKGQKFNESDYKAFLANHRPLISASYYDQADGYGYSGPPLRELVIYKKDFNTSDLIIKPGDPIYHWVFAKVFLPANLTHFVAVDLQELATCLDKKLAKVVEELAENKVDVAE
jgi:hypothetical protein